MSYICSIATVITCVLFNYYNLNNIYKVMLQQYQNNFVPLRPNIIATVYDRR